MVAYSKALLIHYDMDLTGELWVDCNENLTTFGKLKGIVIEPPQSWTLPGRLQFIASHPI